ncbi:TLDc domain-containing protein [Entamoeba marina]
MKRATDSNIFIAFKKYCVEFLDTLNQMKCQFDIDLKDKYNLVKYNQIVEGSDEDVIAQYETWYDQLAEIVINNNIAIKRIFEATNCLTEIIEFTNKEMMKNDEIKSNLNQLVDKIIDKEKEIFEKEQQERRDTFQDKLVELNEMKYTYDTDVYNLFPNDKEIQELAPSINKLKEWCGTKKCSVIFDSTTDGDGSNDGLNNKIIGKKNLCFISFDDNHNVFGGYVDTLINKTYEFITDPNAFLFSLKRNGKVSDKIYPIRSTKHNKAFYLYSNDDRLYYFGNGGDISISKVDYLNSWCDPNSYEYNNQENTFVDCNYPNHFDIKRLIVLQMN